MMKCIMAYTTIKKPSDYFNTNLYTGNNTQTSHTVGFQPDFTWLKVRNAVGNHYLYDAVRGANKDINSNDDTAEYTATQNLMSFDSDGYTVGTSNSVNTNNETMVGWNWKAGTTSGITTNGSTTITPTAYSFNATAGFSIIKYVGTGTTGAKYPHGLGVAPKMVIVKNLGTTDWWNVHHASLGNNDEMYLNTTNRSPGSTGNGTTPDAVNIELEGTTNTHNASGNNYIAYCFADVQGYSKFGSYTGNGNADGTFVYTGFKPAFVLYKDSTSVSDWVMKDNRRPGFNVIDDVLYPNLTDAEGSGADIDFLSNGFKARTTAANTNKNNAGFIYMAFAEEPLVGDNPATAR